MERGAEVAKTKTPPKSPVVHTSIESMGHVSDSETSGDDLSPVKKGGDGPHRFRA